MAVEQPVALDLEVAVSERLTLRYLGYPRDRRPAPHIDGVFRRMWSEGEALIAPRGAFRFVAGSALQVAEMPRPTELVAVGVCTIGSALEGKAGKQADSGEPLKALLLDAFGSAAAEAAADALNAHVCREGRRRGYRSRARVSPGYGRWNVRHQAALLALLPAKSLGITLTDGMMMIPRKSVSFAVALQPGSEIDDEDNTRSKKRCSRCGMTSCPYRDDDATDPENNANNYAQDVDSAEASR